MRKIYFYFMLTFIIISCDNKEDVNSKTQALNNPTQTYIINGDIEYISEITDGSKPKKPILVYDIPNYSDNNNTAYKSSEQSTFLNFHYGLYNPTKSGCTITRYLDSGKSFETDLGVYGPNPYPQINGYLVRGFGVPHQNPYYGALVLIASNKGRKVNTRRGVMEENQKRGSAISIEFPFAKNVSYEITIRTKFHDNRYLIDKKYSDGYPTVYVQLKDDGIITLPNLRDQNQDPCERKDLNEIGRYGIDNYKRSYTPDNGVEAIKDISFKFSPIIEKKALLVSLHPKMRTEGYGAIPINGHTMIILSITITEKPFDPSINVNIPEPVRRRYTID
ncbi:hypothetical protein D0817_03530 [Flavobacterium cupreum]|uniref:Uncharacterized protein n=1 Tax=Flavobacterium cupreum TaxID=2133766 RepID=A0A434ABH2_9FLAO|nr:hypothetical protein [Flavobacterium cupreum]RUT71769.1 hypothetical protein D0817_03530 [Flavobacterium cupreum]